MFQVMRSSDHQFGLRPVEWATTRAGSGIRALRQRYAPRVAMRASPPAGKGEPNSDEANGRKRSSCHAVSSSLPSTVSGPDIDGIVRNMGSAANALAAQRIRAPRSRRLGFMEVNLSRRAGSGLEAV